MEILNDGIYKRHEEILKITSNYENVRDADNEFGEILEQIKELLGSEHKGLADKLEETESRLQFNATFEVYKIALVDGMKLQREIDNI